MKVLVTGADNLNDCDDASLNKVRLTQLEPMPNFQVIRLDDSQCAETAE